MIGGNCVTLYHIETDDATRKETFVRTFFARCSVYQMVDSPKRHDRNGPWSEKETTVRIATDDEITISVGDRLVIGECADAIPPKDGLLVCGFSDNRRGLKKNHHYRVLCR